LVIGGNSVVPEYVCRTGPRRDSTMVEAMKLLLGSGVTVVESGGGYPG
jgi:hypothetical protein